MDRSVLDDIYAFWFGTTGSAEEMEPRRVEFWMRGAPETDRMIWDRFGARVAEAAQQEWDIEQLTQRQAMALVVLFDQFPRNMYRSSGDAYAYDPIAREIARKLCARGMEHYTTMERFILGLPFVHHENMDDQDRAVMLAALATVRANDNSKDGLRFALDQAIRHREVIQKFGRFPHRNVMLGRASTPEEEAFLTTALRGRGF